MAKDNKYGEVTVQDDSLMNPLNGTDEPVFVVRARDTCALGTLEAYAEEASARGASEEFVESLTSVHDRFSAWQEEHRDEVAIPD